MPARLLHRRSGGIGRTRQIDYEPRVTELLAGSAGQIFGSVWITNDALVWSPVWSEKRRGAREFLLERTSVCSISIDVLRTKRVGIVVETPEGVTWLLLRVSPDDAMLIALRGWGPNETGPVKSGDVGG